MWEREEVIKGLESDDLLILESVAWSLLSVDVRRFLCDLPFVFWNTHNKNNNDTLMTLF